MSLRNPFAMQRPELPLTTKVGAADLVQRDWYLFFVSLYNAVTQGAPQPEVSVLVGASPFTYQAVIRGQVLISGGSVSSIEYGRGTTFHPVGYTSGFVQMDKGDFVRITHAGAPDVTYFPM